MPHEFCMQRRVEFADTDMAGILHFSNYFRYMEETEHAFFRSLGTSVHRDSETGFRGWVRGQAECRYEQPLRYQDLVDIRMRVSHVGTKSMRYEFRFGLPGEGVDDAGNPVIDAVAKGKLTVIYVAKEDGDEQLRSIPIPSEIRDLLAPSSPE